MLLASTRAVGEGLTLTEANHVIFFNEWWNPSANRQARDRVVRIGQKAVVQVYRLRTRGTVEELLDRILSRKEQLFELVVDELAVDVDPIATLGTGRQSAFLGRLRELARRL